jgi:hypothetical protein
MANQVVDSLITVAVKLILHLLDCVVLRELCVFERAKVLLSDTVIEDSKDISSVMEVGQVKLIKI